LVQNDRKQGDISSACYQRETVHSVNQYTSPRSIMKHVNIVKWPF